METDLLTAGLNPEAGAVRVASEQLGSQSEIGEQDRRQIVIKESFCAPWAEDPATFDPARAGWEQAAGNVLAKIQEMLAAPEVILTSDGLTPAQAAAKEQEELLVAANARAKKLVEDLAAARTGVAQAAVEVPPSPGLVEAPTAPAETKIDQLVEAPAETTMLATEAAAEPPPAEPPPVAPPTPEAGSPLDQLLEEMPAEMKAEIERRLAEFGENFDEEKFAQEHPEEYAFINQVISETSNPAKMAEAAGKVKAYLDDLDKQEDGDKKKKDFLVNLFGIYKRRFDQETDPEKKEEVKKSMLGLRRELGGLGIGAFGGLLDVIIGAIVGEVQEQLK